MIVTLVHSRYHKSHKNYFFMIMIGTVAARVKFSNALLISVANRGERVLISQQFFH